MNRVAMEGRLTAPPEIGCSHGSSSSRAYHKDDSSGSGTSSPGRSNSSSNSSSASDDSLRRCSVSREDCNSSPDANGDLENDVSRQLLNILVTANNGDMLMTDSTVASLKDYLKAENLTEEALGRIRGISQTTNASCQTDPDSSYPPLVQVMRNPSLSSGSTYADIASTSSTTEGVLPLVIRNFSQMQDTMRGPIVGIRGVPWRIMVMPRQHVVQKKGTQKCLGFFLQCCPTAYSDSWSCQATAELRLISQKPDVPNFTRKTSHSYTAKENDWGYSCFMTWADILDESQGYIKDNTVKVEVSVKAEEPINILTHEQFQKKIQEYIRLADLQAQRGFLDKAIDVNSSATKFCKDKDLICQSELEEQRKRLIEMKLQQSIERIEKGTSNNDDNSANMNALRQALGGGAAARTQKTQKVVKKETDVTVTKEAARKALAVRPKHPVVQDMRRQLDKQYREAARQDKTNRLHEVKMKAQLAAKVNGNTIKTPSSGARFDPPVTAKNGIHCRGVYTAEANGDHEDIVNASGPESDMFSPDNEISLQFTGQEESEFNVHIARVLEHLKEVNPNIQEAMRKTFQQNPSAMSYNEADSFLEEYYGYPCHNTQDSSVQTEELSTACGDDSANVVDAAAKALPASPDDKTRKVKRARKIRGKADGDEGSGEQSQTGDIHQPDSIGDSYEEKLDDFTEPASPSVSTSTTQAGISQIDQPIMNEEGIEMFSNSICHFQPLPMGNVFEFVDRAQDNDNPERPGLLTPGKGVNSNDFVDHIMRQNLNRLITEITHSGRPLHVGVDSNIFKTFPGYSPNHSLGQFEQRLITNSLNMMSVNCMNFAGSIQKLYKFFGSFNLTLVKSNLPACLQELESTLRDGVHDRTLFAEPPAVPPSPLEISPTDGIDCLMEKSCRKLHDFLVNEMRFIVHMIPGFNPLYGEIISEAARVIRTLKKEREDLIKSNNEAKNRELKFEERKTHEMNEIKNSSNGDKDKIADLNKQLRDLKKEMKKLERKCKVAESQATDTNALRERCERAEQKLADMVQKYNELSTQHSRDKQSWQDSKANLVKERQNLENEVKSVRANYDDAKSQTHKLEQMLGSERKSAQANLKAEKERSIKAECAMVDTILEYGMKILERACEDCKTQIGNWEKKSPRNEMEQEIINKNITAWKDKAEEVKAVIASTKTEYNQTIAEIKKGKSLASLPKFSVPKPPSPPALLPMPQPIPQPATQPQPIGPIGTQRRTSPLTMGSGQFVQPQPYPDANRALISPSHTKGMQPNSAAARGSITPQPMNPNFRSNVITTQPNAYPIAPGRSSSSVGLPQQAQTSKTVLPIGVRPPNYIAKNGINMSTTPHMKDNIDNAAAMLSAAQMVASSANRQLNRSPPLANMFNNAPSQDMFATRNQSQPAVSGNRSWYDPLNAYSDLFVDPSRWNNGDYGGFQAAARNSTMSPSLPTENIPVTSAPIGSNRSRQGWFEPSNSPVPNRPS